MNKKIIGIFILLIFISNVISSDAKTIINVTKVDNSQDEFLVYVDMSGIDRIPRSILNNSQKQELKEKILQHLRDNFRNIPGVTFNFTTNSSLENQARRKINILNDYGIGRIQQRGDDYYFYGQCTHQSDTVNVFLKNFYRRSGSDFRERIGRRTVYNVTKLANGIGAVCGHELGHSFCLGHNEHEPSNKMTNGSITTPEELATHNFQFDSYSKNVISRNARNGVNCSSYPDYFLEYDFLHAHFYDLPQPDNDYWDFFRFDSYFEFSGQLADNFEVGWLTLDSDNGGIDGNSQWDFIYKTPMDSNTNPSAEFLTFFENRTDAVLFAIRGIKGGKWQNQWYPVEPTNVKLTDEITRPDGIKVSRHVSMGWDVNYDGDYDVNIYLTSTAYNGFTYGPNSQSEIAIMEIFGGFGISILVENIGPKDIFNVHWNIDIKGMVFIGGISSGKVDIKKGGQYTIESELIIGFGLAEITVNVASVKKTYSCFLLGLLVSNIKEI